VSFRRPEQNLSLRACAGRGRPLAALALTLALLSAYGAGVREAQAARALDVVLVMDCSGSMRKTDPDNLRQQAAKLFVSLLDAEDRVAVVGFEERSVTLAPFLRPGRKAERDRLFAGIDRVGSTGPWTDIEAGLRRAFELLGGREDAGQDRIVVVMTDGRVDTGDADRDRGTTERLRRELADRFRAEEIPVMSLAFTEQSDVRLMEDISFRTGGYMALARSSDELNEVFIQFFQKLKEPESTPVSQNRFRIDGSVKEATLIARKTAPDVDVQLVTPSGRIVKDFVEGGDFVRFQTGSYDLITMKHPEEGEWGIRFSHGKGNRVVLITDLRLETGFDASFLSKDMRVPVEAYLTRGEELLDDPEVIESTRFSLVRVGPGLDEAETTELFDDGRDGDREAGDAVFGGEFRVPGPGSYRLNIEAAGKTFSRVREIAFRATDWWLVPKLAYEREGRQAGVRLELEKRFDEVAVDDLEIEAALLREEGPVPLAFSSAGGAYRARLDAPLAPGRYELELRVRPVVGGEPGFWIEYSGQSLDVEGDPEAAGAGSGGAEEGEETPSPPAASGDGWGRAVAWLLGGNGLLGAVVFLGVWIRRRIRGRRSGGGDDEESDDDAEAGTEEEDEEDGS